MLWVERLTLSNFRNYTQVALEAGPEPQVLIGANGAGKTNLLEAVSLLAPGQGMRRAAYPDLARGTGDGGWAVAAHTHTHMGPIDIGTGLLAENAASERAGRIVRINGETAGAGALADYVEVVWVTPAMDGLFTGPGSERRRFLDRLILCFDPGYRTVAARFERAMQQRNRLLADGVRDASRFEGLELLMAETGVAIAAARAEAVAALAAIMAERTARDPHFAVSRRRPRARRRAGSGSGTPARGRGRGHLHPAPARRARARPGRRAHARWPAPLRSPRRPRAQGHAGAAVLDGRAEGAADRADPRPRRACRAPPRRRAHPAARRGHGASRRRAARRPCSPKSCGLGAQAWMTGTDAQAFAWLAGKARFWRVEDGRLSGFRRAPRTRCRSAF